MISAANHEQVTYENPEANAAGVSPVEFVNRGLRGRYIPAIILGTLFAIPASIIGLVSIKPKYESVATIYVVPFEQSVIYTTQNQAMIGKAISPFVAAQAELIGGRRVLEKAATDSKLIAKGWPKSLDGIARLQRSVTVTPPKRESTLIKVAVEDTDPTLAFTACNAVVSAYETIFNDVTGSRENDEESKIRERRDSLDNSIRVLKNNIDTILKPHGFEGLSKTREEKAAVLRATETQINQLRLAMVNGTAGGEDTITTAELELALAETDTGFQNLLGLRQQQENILREKLSVLTPENPNVIKTQTRIDTLNEQIRERIQLAVQDGLISVPVSQRTLLMTPEDLESQLTKSEKLRTQLNTELTELDTKLSQASDLRADLGKVQEDFDYVNETFQRRAFENQAGSGTIQVQDPGRLPLIPSKDRRVPLAIAAGCAGMGFGMFIVWIYGFIKGSMRYITEVDGQVSSAQLLGSLPLIEEDDPESRELAEMSIHYLRNLLVSRRPRGIGECVVYTLTSPSPGDGKTSVALSLGVSFAVSDHRVLMLDADLIGRGLTTDLRARGEQGLSEAVQTRDPISYTRKTQVEGLDILSAGADEEFPPERLSAESFRELINELRSQYDTILIDTGPILGSLEANIACICSDETIMIVGRGQRSRMFHAAAERLSRIGARCAGVVFNRAIPEDFAKSVTSVSIGARSIGMPAGGHTDPARSHLRSLFISRVPDYSHKDSTD